MMEIVGQTPAKPSYDPPEITDLFSKVDRHMKKRTMKTALPDQKSADLEPPMVRFEPADGGDIVMDMAAEEGVDEILMGFLENSKKPMGCNWVCNSMWKPKVDADGVIRLHVKTISDNLLAFKLKPKWTYDVWSKYQYLCKRVCKNLSSQTLQLGHVIFLVSVHPQDAWEFYDHYGHPIGVIIERVAFTTLIKGKRQLKKGVIYRGECVVTFLGPRPPGHPLDCWFFDFPDLAAGVLVEATLVEIEEDALVVKVNVRSNDTGELFYTARVTFSSSADPAWLCEEVSDAQNGLRMCLLQLSLLPKNESVKETI